LLDILFSPSLGRWTPSPLSADYATHHHPLQSSESHTVTVTYQSGTPLHVTPPIMSQPKNWVGFRSARTSRKTQRLRRQVWLLHMLTHSNHRPRQVVVYVYSNSPLLDAPETIDLFKELKIKNDVVFLRLVTVRQISFTLLGFSTRSYPIRTLGSASTSPRAEWAIPVLNLLPRRYG
jgi:hypothetical protein